ncbi:hypothetical protein N752_23955 [Desulforamulus aquiferis]|nr:hypothetical protein N752_23955 [Desulforamulus aquiferis]
MSSSSTRISFQDWLEIGLTEQAESILNNTIELAGITSVETIAEVKVGKTETVIYDTVSMIKPLLLVLPNPYSTAPGAAGGLSYNIKSLTKKITCPIYLGPKLPIA